MTQFESTGPEPPLLQRLRKATQKSGLYVDPATPLAAGGVYRHQQTGADDGPLPEHRRAGGGPEVVRGTARVGQSGGA